MGVYLDTRKVAMIKASTFQFVAVFFAHRKFFCSSEDRKIFVKTSNNRGCYFLVISIIIPKLINAVDGLQNHIPKHPRCHRTHVLIYFNIEVFARSLCETNKFLQ